MSKFQVKRGLKANLPGVTLAQGEPAFTTDDGKLYIGNGTDKVLINPDQETYTHPSGDGNSHVPATGTKSSGKVLKAGTTAGSAEWDSVTFSELAETPTTLAGYGITDALSKDDDIDGGTF